MNLINKNLIELNIQCTKKEDVIKSLSDLIDKEKRLNDYNGYVSQVLKRESMTSTGIGFGIAIPHGKCSAVSVPAIAFGRLKNKVEWESLDDTPIKVVFLLAVPEESASDGHLKILAALSRKLLDEAFREKLFNMNDKEELLKMFSNMFEKTKL